MPYPEMLVAPMRAELTSKGFTELKTAEEVENAMKEYILIYIEDIKKQLG